MANGRLTEDIVRTHFREYPLFKSIRLEEQRLYSRRVSRLLKSASKTGGKGPGLPELLIQKAIELNEEYNNYSISVRSSARRNTATTTDASGTRRRCMNPSFGCPLARARRIGSGWSTS